MKKILSCFISVLLFCTCFKSQSQSTTILLEAETARNGNSAIVCDSLSSGGKYILLKDSLEIEWNVSIEEDGWYDLGFCYRSTKGEVVATLTRNDYTRSIGFGYCTEWGKFTTSTFLKKGNNKISLSEDWGPIDLDYLLIQSSEVSPEIKPLANYFYKSDPHDITIKVNRFGSKIDSVRLLKYPVEYSINDYPFQEDAVDLMISAGSLMKIPVGCHKIYIYFSSGDVIIFELNVLDHNDEYRMEIIIPHVDHGSAVIFKLPNKETMLIDCGKAWVRDSILIPLLKKENITRIDHFIITHYHEDHDSDDRGEKIKQMFKVKNFYDYNILATGDEFNIDEVHIKVLNSHEDGKAENERSLCLKIEYEGFIYVHGGDIYGNNQQKILKRFPDDVRADVYYANHHFHGSVDVEYLREVNPYIVLLQAQEAIYARSAYTEKFKKDVADYLHANNGHYIEDMPNLEVGTVIIRVKGKGDWTYESFK